MPVIDVKAILLNEAQKDMRKARKHGVLLISETVIGLIELSYDRATKTYGIVSYSPAQRYEFSGYPAANTAEALAALYKVEVQLA